jgi:hypothetical protein
VLKCKATDTDESGKEVIENTGALDTKCMETSTRSSDGSEGLHRTAAQNRHSLVLLLHFDPPREGFFYWSDDGDLLVLRVRRMNLYELKADPFERAPSSIYYAHWQVHRVFIQVPAQAIVAKMLESFKEFPPRAKAASFTVSVMEKIEAASPQRN